MKPLLPIFLLLASVSIAFTAEKEDATPAPADGAVFREPFTLNLHVDKEHFYEQKVGKIPFVLKGDVYLFKGDEFGLMLEIQDDAIRAVKYEPDVKKADVTLKFTQEIRPDGSAMMMLVIRNGTKHPLKMDALMTVPNSKGVATTSILPILPGLSNYESWPHPIVQLVLRNLRIESDSKK